MERHDAEDLMSIALAFKGFQDHRLRSTTYRSREWAHEELRAANELGGA